MLVALWIYKKTNQKSRFYIIIQAVNNNNVKFQPTFLFCSIKKKEENSSSHCWNSKHFPLNQSARSSLYLKRSAGGAVRRSPDPLIWRSTPIRRATRRRSLCNYERDDARAKSFPQVSARPSLLPSALLLQNSTSNLNSFQTMKKKKY